MLTVELQPVLEALQAAGWWVEKGPLETDAELVEAGRLVVFLQPPEARQDRAAEWADYAERHLGVVSSDPSGGSPRAAFREAR
jgi:hypothetical protein